MERGERYVVIWFSLVHRVKVSKDSESYTDSYT